VQVEDIFIINGFYMAMRGKFTEAPAKIHYFSVEWDAAALSWEDFRGKVLGATDPTTAAEGSLRRTIFNKWQEVRKLWQRAVVHITLSLSSTNGKRYAK
jgi:hypothetical protein